MHKNGIVPGAEGMQIYENYSSRHDLVYYHTASVWCETIFGALECADTLITEVPKSPKYTVAIVEHPVRWITENFLRMRMYGLPASMNMRKLSHASRKAIEKGSLIHAFQTAVTEVTSERGFFDIRLAPQTSFFHRNPEVIEINRVSSSRDMSRITHWLPLEVVQSALEMTIGTKVHEISWRTMIQPPMTSAKHPTRTMDRQLRANWGHMVHDTWELQKLEQWMQSTDAGNTCVQSIIDVYAHDMNIYHEAVVLYNSRQLQNYVNII